MNQCRAKSAAETDGSRCIAADAPAFCVHGEGGRGSVLVTGGARRIGKAICETLAARGWRVIVHSRLPDDEDAAALAVRIGGVAVSGDLSEHLGAAQVFLRSCEACPDLCAVVNNAAVFSAAAELPPDESDRIFRVNAEAPEKLSILLATRLMERCGAKGSVVNLLDCRVLRALPPGGTESPYLASKRALAAATARHAGLFASCLRVNAVAPGPVLAPADPGQRVPGGEILLDCRPTAQDVASAVAYLLDASAVTGQTVAVDSGQSLLP